MFIESESETIEDENFEFDEGIAKIGETGTNFDLNVNQNNQEV